MSEPKIVVTDTPEPRDAEVIVQGLSDFNTEHVGTSDRRTLTVLVKDAEGNTVGGIGGNSSFGLLFIDLVYLPKALRGGGLAAACWRWRRRRDGGAAAGRRSSTRSVSRRRTSTSATVGALWARSSAIAASAGSS